MANPNAYVSFVVLFTFLLSPLVFTHHLPEVVSHPNGARILWPPLIPPDENDRHKISNYVEFQQIFSPMKNNDNDKTYYHHNDFQLADPPETGIHPSHMKDNSLQSHKFRRSVVGHPDVEPTYYEDGTEVLKRENYEDEIGTQKKRNYEDETEILKKKNYENGIGALNKKNYENEIILTHRKMMKP